jgi:hypothetical protein
MSDKRSNDVYKFKDACEKYEMLWGVEICTYPSKNAEGEVMKNCLRN